MKRQRNTTQMKEQTRNTEVQIHEQKIGKPPGEEVSNDSKDDKKKKQTLKTEWRKCKNQLTKT